MVFAAQELRDFIFTNWSLGGALSKVSLDNMKEIVQFFSRPQILGNEVTKAIEVIKNADQQAQDVTEHPKFTEKTDIYDITLRYRVTDTQQITYDEALTNMELMQNELLRILRLQFFPSATVGVFQTMSKTWTIRDNYNTAQPDVIRTLQLRLTEITSEEPQVFRGFGGVTAFDVSESQGDDLPAIDYVYTEIYNVRLSEGFGTIPVLTNDTTRGIGVPELMRGMFTGKISYTMYLKADDIDGSDDSKLDKILIPRSNADLPTVTFLHSHTNQEPRTLTARTTFKVSNVERTEGVGGLVSIKITGDVVKPTAYVLA